MVRGGPRPVRGVGHVEPARHGAALLLAHVVRPAAAVLADAAGHHEQRDDGAVGDVRVEPVADAGADDDHRAALRLLRVRRELTGDAEARLGGHRGDLRLPGGGVGNCGVVVPGRPLAREAVAAHAVLGEHEVEDGGDELALDHAGGDAAVDDAALALRVLEARQGDLHLLRVGLLDQGERGPDLAEVEVPQAGAVLGVAVAHGAVRHRRAGGGVVPHHRLEGGVGDLCGGRQVRGGEELAGHQPMAVGVIHQRDEHAEVRVLLDVLVEVLDLLVDEVLLEDHVAHGHGQRGVGAGLRGQPLVGELHVVRVVRADRDHLGAAVADLGHPVRVRGAGDGDVGAPHHQVGGIPPVAGLGHVGLVAEHLRGGDGEVGVPVVEAGHRAADEVREAGADGVGDHAHRRDGREGDAAVRAVELDGVDVGRGRDLNGLLPRDAHQAALAARLLVAAALDRIGGDLAEGLDGVPQALLRLAVHLDEHAAAVRVADPGGRVGVPRKRGPTGASAGLVLGPVRPGRRVVRLLGLPGDDPVLDVDLPGAGAGAVDAVRGADHLVVAPAVAVEDVPGAATLAEHGPAVVGLVPLG